MPKNNCSLIKQTSTTFSPKTIEKLYQASGLRLWKLLDIEETIGVKLTESLAMWPASSVSGYYFAHPQTQYFGLGKIKEDQLISYSKRRGIDLEEARKWLSPNLADQ